MILWEGVFTLLYGGAAMTKERVSGRIGWVLIDAKQSGHDQFAAINAVMSWDAFTESVTEAQNLAQPDNFDFLHRIDENYAIRTGIFGCAQAAGSARRYSLGWEHVLYSIGPASESHQSTRRRASATSPR